ncbi:MAG TPA: phosphoribosylglycinamide synthetase C domain-containing protein [Verrucomicrobiae bacterium]|nr:phosphoribosylglycinamide synthetase C domain-containing protein [Verrucomicrobiae bacterium]
MSKAKVMAFGVGAYTQGMLRVLRESGAHVSTYLTRAYAHYPPSLEGLTFDSAEIPNPCALIREKKIDFILPQSIDWAQKPWADEFLATGVPIFCPTGEALKLERERDFARQLCASAGIPFPVSYVAGSLSEAREIVARDPRPYVIKNPLCSPTSPVHTIVCETVADTLRWLERIDYAEGAFLQQYMGRAEAGHIAVVSNGEIHSLVTNQEYKRAFNGNMGIVAGAPLGGLVEKDPDDRYGLARECLHPLLPWFRETNFHGPVQVTAIRDGNRWSVLEYNVRVGVTSGPMILRMLENPIEVLRSVCHDEHVRPVFKSNLSHGCNITLAGYGYPFVQLTGPIVPVEIDGDFDCDVFWNEVGLDEAGVLCATGHRICDVVALGSSMNEAISKVYSNIAKIRCLGSYYRTDVGQSLWPPGTV